MAEWPSSGYAEWALFPSATSRSRSEPFVPVASLFSVGSPLMSQRQSRARGCRFAARAPLPFCSSSTTKSRPSSRTPPARSRSAAAICAAMIPLASQAPRPCRNSASSRAGTCGGTVSRWLEKTTRAGAPVVASTLGRPGAKSCRSTIQPRSTR